MYSKQQQMFESFQQIHYGVNSLMESWIVNQEFHVEYHNQLDYHNHLGYHNH